MKMKMMLYSEAQWKWVQDRWQEGYYLEELAEFLDLHLSTVSKNIQRVRTSHKKRTRPKNLVPLDKRKREFYVLWNVEKEGGEDGGH